MRKSLGQGGELLAEKFLRRLGYKILRRNWRSRHGEIDLIARDGDEVVFVEVKTRSSAQWGDPEQAISPAQERTISLAAGEFAERNRLRGRTLRFDVVAVLFADGAEPAITHYKDAFTAPPFMR